ncbi:MAG: hypothetical protein QG552_738 [Thermodesulfobacteriota bacterium]|nr:hypothetical protein [Thermodesulfobacteriota bacterium]
MQQVVQSFLRGHMVKANRIGFLVRYAFTDRFFMQSYRAYKIATYPERYQYVWFCLNLSSTVFAGTNHELLHQDNAKILRTAFFPILKAPNYVRFSLYAIQLAIFHPSFLSYPKSRDPQEGGISRPAPHSASKYASESPSSRRKEVTFTRNTSVSSWVIKSFR